MQKFKIPLKILSPALDNLGDFPFKDPEEVRFEKPSLFIRGIHSKYVPDEALPIIGKFFPMFQLVDIDAGHWVISEQPEAFRRGMSSFSITKEILTLRFLAVVEFLQARD
jgi:pimeloyl-ACP methyl ester carboxylesterase